MVSIGRIAKATGRLIFQDDKFLKVAKTTLTASKKSQGWKKDRKSVV